MNNSQLPDGYKLTEVGMVPEGWEVQSLEDLTEKHRPISYGIVQTGPNIPSGIPCLRVIDIDNGRIDKTKLIHTSQKISDGYKRTILKLGDLVMPLRGKVGDVGIIDSELEGANLTRGVAIIAICSHLSGEFCRHFISWSVTRKRLEQAMNGSALQEIPIAALRTFKIGLPSSITEQRSIATALSDMDELLGGLDRLIAKKHDLKQAAMQKLLRSETGWIEYLFSDVCWFQEGPGVRNHQFTTSGVKLFNGTNIEKGKIDLDKTNRYISEKEAFGWYSHFMADIGDIVIACSGISIDKFDEKVSVIKAQHLPLCMNTSTMRFKVNLGKIDKSYLQQFLRSNEFKEQIGDKATGSAQLNFGPSHVSAVKIWLPELSEQTAIASILSDMDTEIAAIEQRRNKTRDLKQAMMQELLTGRIRLV